ncbi:MAG: PEP-CTERM sorting domain-containing protein [Verrucomicrobiota bacterium]
MKNSSLPRILIYAAAACLLMYATATAQAAVITIQNYSFENATGYYAYSSGNSSWQNAGNTLTGGVTPVGYGMVNVTDTLRYTGGGYLGANSLNIHVDTGGGGVTGSTWISSVSLGTYAANTVYTLIVAAVPYNCSDPNRSSIIALGTNGTDINSTLVSLTTVNNSPTFAVWQAFHDITLTLDTSVVTSAVGQNIVVFLEQSVASGTVYGGDMYYDNVRLTSAVPEPTTWALLAFSLTGVVVFRRRRLG